ncbi:MAG: hypothetical protein KDC85_20660 [Saprospiraceae bacterium]|nr:hypothetical protein [Saprospiraceae bacterium]MCB9322574.1 hypothetical protein [Lewinellaceae bacterium]
MEYPYRFSNRWPARTGFVTMVLLLLLSVVFYKERTLFADIAYQTFLMIQEGGLQVQVFRFGSAIVHVLPYLAIQAGFPLEVVLILYSISFTLLYLCLYLLIVKWFKNDYMGLVLVFLFTLTVLDGFYWATSEFQQGLAFTLFFYAFLLRFPTLKKGWQKLFVFFLIPTLVFYHPLIFVPFFFLFLFFLLTQPDFRRKEMYVTAGFFILVMVLKHLFAGNWYDSGKFEQFTKGLTDYFPNYLSMPVNRKFLVNSLKYWYFFPIFLFVVEAWYLRRKNWVSAGFVLLSCLGYLALVHIGSPHATYRFYIEVSYMPLTIFVMTPFVFEILPKVKLNRIVTFLIIIFGFRLFAIFMNHKPYTERLEWISQKIGEEQEKEGGQLFVMQNSPEIEDKMIISWGISYESILLSAMEGKEKSFCLLMLQRKGQYKEELAEKKYLLTNFQKIPFEEVNPQYFRFNPAKYRWIGE